MDSSDYSVLVDQRLEAPFWPEPVASSALRLWGQPMNSTPLVLRRRAAITAYWSRYRCRSGIAALAFGLGDVPADWWQTLARYKDIVDLGQQLGQAISENPYPLRGVPIEYTDPTEPVALDE